VLAINAVYSLYLKGNIKILAILNKVITTVAANLTRTRIKLEVKAHRLTTRRNAIKGETSEQEREIPKIWYYCRKCGAVTDDLVKSCPTGCGFSSLDEVKLEMPQVVALLRMNKIWTSRPAPFFTLVAKQKPAKK